MVNFRSLTCDDEARRAALLDHATLNGIDYIEVVSWSRLQYAVTADPLTDVFTAEGSEFPDGHPITFRTDGSLPTPVDAGKTYFVREVSGASFKVAESRGGATVDIADSGSGQHAVDPLNQRVLNVFLLDKPGLAEILNDLHAQTEAVKIVGGVRTRNIKVVDVARGDDHLQVCVDQPGDFSNYTLFVKHPSLDEPYKQCEFNFKIGCPSRFDCKQEVVCPTEPVRQPPIDYLAKDYASFRRALLDLIPTLAPHWEERLAADLGITLVELLAYVGDYLSYYQDAVANETFLAAARQRVSVRRHARLIDYRMHDGASARTAVFIRVREPGGGGRLPPGTQILSRIDVPLESRRPPHPSELSSNLQESALGAAGAVFETIPRVNDPDPIKRSVYVHPSLNRMKIYTWGNQQCCLPRGTTTLDLVGDWKAVIDEDVIRRGTGLLLLEEVKGPKTGLSADADPGHRQLVRLLGPAETIPDTLLDKTLTRIHWHPADALRFPLCISAGSDIQDVSVARGNLVMADHGRTIAGEKHDGPRRPPDEIQRRAHRIRLAQGPLSFRMPVQPSDDETVSAASLQSIDPRTALPQVTRLQATGATEDWEPVSDLLDSPRFAQHFAVETDNRGRANLRFGDNVFGLSPRDMKNDNDQITVDYRIGVGTVGNVGRDALNHVINPGNVADWPQIDPPIDGEPSAVRNPLPAWGGVDPESIEQVKQHAPPAFHAQQFRAVTEADYAEIAERHPEVGHAVATFRWTGSWHTVFINIDPVGRTFIDDNDNPETVTLAGRVHDWVAGFALAGYDLEVKPPIYVPLKIEIDICVDREHFRPDVEQELLRILSQQEFPDGSRGLFHPDNLTFDQAFFLSQLFSAVESVQGVDSAIVRRFIRQDQDDPEPVRPATRKNLDQGYIDVGRLEIVRLDNDPNFPENGVLTLNMLGGK